MAKSAKKRKKTKKRTGTGMGYAIAVARRKGGKAARKRAKGRKGGRGSVPLKVLENRSLKIRNLIKRRGGDPETTKLHSKQSIKKG